MKLLNPASVTLLSLGIMASMAEKVQAQLPPPAPPTDDSDDKKDTAYYVGLGIVAGVCVLLAIVVMCSKALQGDCGTCAPARPSTLPPTDVGGPSNNDDSVVLLDVVSGDGTRQPSYGTRHV